MNTELIDEIHIGNMGLACAGLHLYKIIKPVGFEDIEILHQRKNGYKALLGQALARIRAKEMKQ